MKNATHTITIVEPVDMVEEMKRHTKKETYGEFISRTLQKDTYKRVYDLLEKNFADSLEDFKELIRITEVSKDMGFSEQTGKFIKYMEDHHAMAYFDYLTGNKTVDETRA